MENVFGDEIDGFHMNHREPSWTIVNHSLFWGLLSQNELKIFSGTTKRKRIFSNLNNLLICHLKHSKTISRVTEWVLNHIHFWWKLIWISISAQRLISILSINFFFFRFLFRWWLYNVYSSMNIMKTKSIECNLLIEFN